MPTPAQPGVLDRLWDNIVHSAEHSPLGGGGLARAWYKLHGYTDAQINAAIAAGDKDFQQKYQNAPVFQGQHYLTPDNIGRAATSLVGTLIGGADPTYAFGGAGRSIPARIAHQAVTQGAADVARQRVEMNTGQRKNFDPSEVVRSTVTGGALQGAGEAAHSLASGPKPDFETTDIVPYTGKANEEGKAPVGAFSSPKEAAMHMRANGYTPATHDIVAHGDNSYSVVPRETMPTGEAVPSDNGIFETEDMPQGQAPATQSQAPVAQDGLPGNGSVKPIDPQMMARIMGDPGAVGGEVNAHDFETEELAKEEAKQPQEEEAQLPDTTPEPAQVPENPQAEQDQMMEQYIARGVPMTGIQEAMNRPMTPMLTQADYTAEATSPQHIDDQATPAQQAEANQALAPQEAPQQQIPQGYEAPAQTPHDLETSPQAGTFSEVRADPDGTKYLNYHATNGETLPIKMGIEPDGTAEMAIDQFANHSNRLGPAEIRGAMHNLMQMYPEIQRFGGYRRSGAGKGRVQEINPVRRLMADQRGSLGPGPMNPGIKWRQTEWPHVGGRLPEDIEANPTPDLTHSFERGPSYQGDGKTVPIVRVHDKNTGETLAIARRTPFEKKEDWVKRAYAAVKTLMTDERGSLGSGREYEDDEPTSSDQDETVHKLITAIKEMRPLRAVVTKAIREERSARFTEANKALHGLHGEAALHGALGALKGDMPQAVIPSVRKYFSQDEIDHLQEIVKNSNRVSGYDKINAMRALSEILHKDYAKAPTAHDEALLNKVFPKALTAALKDEPDFLESAVHHGANILGITRAVKTVGDLGVAFRQCLPLVGTKAFWQAMPEMFKGIASEKLYQHAMEAIRNMPEYQAMKDAKVAFTDLTDNLTEREEFAASKIAEKIPLVRRSERGFTAYLNTVRALTFARLYNDAEKWGIDKDDPNYLKYLGNIVNVFSGRGSLGEVGDKAAPLLAAGLFSPRLQWSRVQYLTMLANPRFYSRLPMQLKVEYLKSIIAVSGFILASLGIMKEMFGAKVNQDPKSTDFARAKIQRTRIDPTGSFQPYVRVVAQIASGKKITAAGKEEDLGSKYGAPTRLDTALSFIESKASPNADLVLNEFRGKDWRHPKQITGQTMDWEKFGLDHPLVDSSIPMGLDAMLKAGNQYGYKSPLPYISGALETFGWGANTYDQKNFGVARASKDFKTPKGEFTRRSSEFSTRGEF